MKPKSNIPVSGARKAKTAKSSPRPITIIGTADNEFASAIDYSVALPAKIDGNKLPNYEGLQRGPISCDPRRSRVIDSSRSHSKLAQLFGFGKKSKEVQRKLEASPKRHSCDELAIAKDENANGIPYDFKRPTEWNGVEKQVTVLSRPMRKRDSVPAATRSPSLQVEPITSSPNRSAGISDICESSPASASCTARSEVISNCSKPTTCASTPSHENGHNLHNSFSASVKSSDSRSRLPIPISSASAFTKAGTNYGKRATEPQRRDAATQFEQQDFSTADQKDKSSCVFNIRRCASLTSSEALNSTEVVSEKSEIIENEKPVLNPENLEAARNGAVADTPELIGGSEWITVRRSEFESLLLQVAELKRYTLTLHGVLVQCSSPQ